MSPGWSMAISIDPNHGFLIKARRETLFGPNSNKVPGANPLNCKKFGRGIRTIWQKAVKT